MRDFLLRMSEPLPSMQDFLSVSERKQENRIIGLVNRKKGGDAWVPLRDVHDNATIADVTSMSVLDSKSSISHTISCSYMYRRKRSTTEATVTDLEKYAERVGFPKETLPQRNRDKLVEVLRAIWGGEL